MCSHKLLIDPKIIFGDFVRLRGEVTELTFIPSGMSMYPFIIGGHDIVKLRKQSIVKYLDIVVAHIPDKGYVLHRVYKVSGNRLTLMGDGNIQAKEYCEIPDVVGVVSYINGTCCNSIFFRFGSYIWIKLRFVRKYLLWLLRKKDSRLSE